MAGILNVAMMLAAQSLDLYMRYAAKSTDDRAKEILHHLADEEKTHLKRLGSLLENRALEEL